MDPHDVHIVRSCTRKVARKGRAGGLHDAHRRARELCTIAEVRRFLLVPDDLDLDGPPVLVACGLSVHGIGGILSEVSRAKAQEVAVRTCSSADRSHCALPVSFGTGTCVRPLGGGVLSSEHRWGSAPCVRERRPEKRSVAQYGGLPVIPQRCYISKTCQLRRVRSEIHRSPLIVLRGVARKRERADDPASSCTRHQPSTHGINTVGRCSSDEHCT